MQPEGDRFKIWELIGTDNASRRVFSSTMIDQSEQSYVLALNSVISKAGRPGKILTDPGSQRVSFAAKQKQASQMGMSEEDADSQVEDMLNLDAMVKVRQQLPTADVEFKVAVAKAPWRNGMVESLIGTIKQILRQELLRTNTPLNIVHHQYLMTYVLAAVNDCPLVLFPHCSPIQDKYLVTPSSIADSSNTGILPQLIWPTAGQKNKRAVALEEETQLRSKRFNEIFSSSYLKRLLKFKGVKPNRKNPPVEGDVVFLLDKTATNHHGYKVGVVTKIDHQDVTISYQPGPASKVTTIVRPWQEIDVLVRKTDALETMDFFKFPMEDRE